MPGVQESYQARRYRRAQQPLLSQVSKIKHSRNVALHVSFPGDSDVCASQKRYKQRFYGTVLRVVTFLKALRKISFCSVVPIVTRIALGAPQGPNGRTTTPSAWSRSAMAAASSPNSQ